MSGKLRKREVGMRRLEPSVRQVRAVFSQEDRSKSTLLGLSLFLIAAAAYGGTFVGSVLAPDCYLRILTALLNSILIGMLFIIGHDACHGSLTPIPWLNRLLGRLAFLPGLNLYTSWEFSHNGMHHAWTNLKTKDPGYPPFSKEEFDALPRYRQRLERIYRTAFGVAIYYFVDVWWKREAFPSGSARPIREVAFQLDRLLVFAFLGTETWATFLLAYHRNGGFFPTAFMGAACGTVLGPFIIWNWIVGFLTFQHHTHPKVAWYGDESEWSFYRGHLQGTVHVVFPRWLELLLHNIMDHTAHHIDPKIPLYSLHECQEKLERAFPADVVILKWTLGQYFTTLSRCKLYDYKEHCWLDFHGNPTSEPIISRSERNGFDLL
jgi:omega-6 fatty acid desaturase (delta-12 desaturase)